MSLTFNTKEEAKVYAKQLMDEGYEPLLKVSGNKFIITKGVYFGNIQGVAYPEAGFAIFENGASTKTKVHEYGHLELHSNETRNYHNALQRELEAELYTSKKMGKGNNVNLNTIKHIASNDMSEWGRKASEEMPHIENELRRKGRFLDIDEKAELWNYLKECETTLRKERNQ